MQKRLIHRGRPAGTKTHEPESARAFGMAVRARRTEQGTAQEALAHHAGIERSHMGKIERGEHMPTLALILRIAEALGCTASVLIADTESNLTALRRNGQRRIRVSS
ncbi:MAG: helix-turn-helix domain-containing protein [Nitrospiraceae bacterium]